MKLAARGAGALVLQAFLVQASLGAAPHENRASSNADNKADDLLYEAIAKRWLQRNEAESASKGGWPALLEERFAHLALGVFEVYVPTAALSDAKALKDTGAALLALLETQAGWAAWVAGTTSERPAKSHPLAKWLGAWTPKAFAKRSAAGAELSELAGAPPGVDAALEELRAEWRRGTPLGLERELAGVRLVLFPRRAEFVEFVCVLGALDARLKPSAWSEGLTTWLEFQADDTRCLTLEYSDSDSELERGAVSVGARNPAALGELVTQVASRALLERAFSARLDPALASGMANALVIDLYGELDTRIDGDVRSRSSEGSSTFVPGGNPNGGVLPATSAENRWRGTKGRDHFVGILSQVQKQSGKKGSTRPEKLTRFELQSDDGARKVLVSAPFLGASAVRPAAEVFSDYLELVRCYGVAFLHWLRLAGAGEPEASAASYGAFLRALGRGVESKDLPRVLQELYGQPLSAAGVDELFDEPTLEGRFLAWLARQS